MSAAAADAASRLLDAFDRQVVWCRDGGSAFSARVLALGRAGLAADPQARADLVAASADPLAGATALRWLGALHHLALLGREPWAGLWPPRSPEPGDDDLREAIALAWRSERAHLRAALTRPPQTNEVMRSAALLPGLLHIAAATGQPLHLAEIGASAGLNLWCDHYRHGTGAWAWGDPAAPLTLRAQWRGGSPPLGAPLHITRRTGCDIAPVDLSLPGEDLRLASFVWADQAERLARLRAAIAIVQSPRPMPSGSAGVLARSANDFVREQLAMRHDGETFVLMHSVVWQYIDAAEQDSIDKQMQAAARAATTASPLAWLRFEPPRPELRVALRCTLWPGGEDRLLAVAHPHGSWIAWCGDGPGAAMAASSA